MDFPVLFDDALPPENAPSAKASPSPEKPSVANKASEPPRPDPVRQAPIEDVDSLRRALDKQARQPIFMLGEQLVSEGVITREELQRAIKVQTTRRGKRIGDILVSLGIVGREAINSALAKRLGVPFVNLRALPISPEALTLVPKKLARKLNLVPCIIHRNYLVVAAENPLSQEAIKELCFITGKHILEVVADREAIEWAIIDYYMGSETDDLSHIQWI